MEFNCIIVIVPLLFLPIIVGSLLCHAFVPWSTRWLFGVSVTGVFFVCMHAFGIRQLFVWIILSLCCMMIGIRSYLHRNILLGKPRFPSWPTLIIFTVLIIQLLSAYVSILANPVIAWDAVAIWFQKAKALYYWMPFSSTPLVNYPNFGAAYWAFIMKFSGFSEEMGRLFFPTVYFAFIMVLFSLFSEKNTLWTALFVIPSISLYFFNEADVSGYQDGLLSLMAGISAFYYGRFFIKLRSNLHASGNLLGIDYDIFFAVFFSGILGLIKNEGVLITGLLFVSAAGWFFIDSSKNIKLLKVLPLMACMVLLLFLTSLWSLLLLYNGVDPFQVQGMAFTFQGVMNAYKNMNRYPDIRHYFVQYLNSQSGMIIFASLLSLASILFIKVIRTAIGFIWSFYLLHFVFVSLIFFSTAQDYQWHLETAFFRLMFQHRFVYMVVIAITICYAIHSLGVQKLDEGGQRGLRVY